MLAPSPRPIPPHNTSLIPITLPYFGEEEERAAAEVIRSGWVTQGPKVAEFERAVADYCGTPHAVAVSSGTWRGSIAPERPWDSPPELPCATASCGLSATFASARRAPPGCSATLRTATGTLPRRTMCDLSSRPPCCPRRPCLV